MPAVLEQRVGQPLATAEVEADPPAMTWASPSPFDRSSITADLMVTIEGVTEAEWWDLAPDNQVCEYWDGVIYMPPPASLHHQEDVGFWYFLLSGYVEQEGLGRVILGPGVLPLAPGRRPEPDVFVLPPGDGPHDPPALLVVETLSKSTRTHDLKRKATGYREAQIPEIVHVDLDHRRIIVSRRLDDLYTSEVVEGGIWRSESIVGFWLDVDWLWQDMLPKRLDCLVAILAGLPAAPAP